MISIFTICLVKKSLFNIVSIVFSDIDECDSETSSPCAASASCQNTYGSYVCSCQLGQEDDNDGGCQGKAQIKVLLHSVCK